MKAGTLDRRVTIQRRTVTLDAFGGEAESWTDLVTVWASREDVTDGERWRAAEVSATVTSRFMLRWSSVTATLTPVDRLAHEGRIYGIQHVKEIGRREGIEITAASRAE